MTDSFFDTSALVKRYAEEPGTETVDELIDDADATVFITSLSVIEMTSAFRRKYDRDDVTEETMLALLSTFSTKHSPSSSSFPWTKPCSIGVSS